MAENLLLQQQPASDVLLVCFSSNAVLTGPGFELTNYLSQFAVNRLFLRDPARLWYLLGVPGIGLHPVDIARRINEIADELSTKRLVMVGASSGGYAAILFGIMCPADEIVAYVPQTRLLEPGDSRTPWRIARLHRRYPIDDPLLNLESFYRSSKPTGVRINVLHTNDHLDFSHARELAGLPNVRIENFDYRGHFAIRSLLRDRRAYEVLAQAIKPELRESAPDCSS